MPAHMPSRPISTGKLNSFVIFVDNPHPCSRQGKYDILDIKERFMLQKLGVKYLMILHEFFILGVVNVSHFIFRFQLNL
jgi:hypothetical protein